MSLTNTLQVLLHDTPVGILSLNRNDGGEFRLLESYKQAYPRPVLGQVFLDDLDKIHWRRARVPPWFSNLLPEGPLRELIARQAGVFTTREFFLLNHLGEDLPGAVRIIADESLRETDEPEHSRLDAPKVHEEWHFSLAGVQLKFSARKTERGLTIPVTGRDGDWIVKLPDARYPMVPENEYATMLWAGASGIAVPELELVKVMDVSGLPDDLRANPEQRVLASPRFDRTAPDTRVHMEDFAQILGLYPEEKYEKFNYETLASFIYTLTGEDGLRQFIRRLVFLVISGNGDAHHKNWSILYPDGITAELSPAYDLVSTIQYLPNDKLALNFAKTKSMTEVEMAGFRRMARKLGKEEEPVVAYVQEAVAAIMDAWRESSNDFGYTAEAQANLKSHFARIPLLRTPG